MSLPPPPALDPARIQLTLDPWAKAEASAISFEPEEPATVPVDVAVEGSRWEAIPARPGDDTGPLVFIDGVRRVEARVIARVSGHDGEVPHFGLLGAYAVGAVRAVDGPPTLLAPRVVRLLVLGGGLDLGPLRMSLDLATFVYASHPVPEMAPEAPLQGLQTAMRRAEADLARELAGEPAVAPARAARSGRAQIELGDLAPLAQGALIVADGPLAWLERTRTPLVGLVKSLHRSYLGPRERLLWGARAPGAPTPVFAILDNNRRYSWYLRLGRGGPADHPLAGIARLECGSAAGIEAAVSIAERSAPGLLRSASTRDRDPRSPQNLVPLGGLELLLRHRLGDPGLARRAITAHLAGAARALAAGAA
jgi:hypothetical protein